MDILSETARAVFGIDALFPYQRLVISNILRKAGLFSEEETAEAPDNQVVLLPTGAGKSLCFMLPAALLPGMTIVVFPLLGLMADQLRRVEEAGIKGALLKGGMSAAEKAMLWDKARQGDLQILLTNPEMLTLPDVQERLRECRIAHLVFDEAHTIPEWGESFRPACLDLGEVIPTLPVEQMTLFTATASPLILEKIRHYMLREKSYNLIRANPDRVNIHYEVRPVLSRNRGLLDVLESTERPCIVFCPTRRECEQTAFTIRTRCPGIDARYYHAGLSAAMRTKREAWFFETGSGILCATCAYGIPYIFI